MFQPVSISGKLFKKYLLSGNHPSKVRFQNLIGEYIFKKGIIVKDEHDTSFNLLANDWMTRIILLEGSYEYLSVNLAGENHGEWWPLYGHRRTNFGLYSCILSQNSLVNVYVIEPNYMVISRLLI